ncbi:hypothetical protein [Tengunoibacter tsumagoiensis]|uniref:Uncharacterized protein n=1 Tax=Tengunoibacter tsumagoiensis TaxID=2014871 RepID=A0A402A8N8_9CHLR|nr:hypothetical protein [Tengunoibacter tsumagoiensis]GCE15534.1 hypothetical protein KTT_53930 [Tengunoibacter tsumagoiensis]
MIRIYAVNIEATKGNERPIHITLLGAVALIVEPLCNPDQLPDEGFRFSALPLKFKGDGTFRAHALACIG